MKMRLYICLLLISCCVSRAQDASPVREKESEAFVSGHVYGANGKPLAHAHIRVFPLEAATSGFVPWAISDENGAYRLRSPDYGKSRITASLDNAGYPDTDDKVFSSGREKFPEVQLVGGAVLADVDIRLGQPDGIVEVTVVDKDTQEVLRFARITLRWADDPSVMYSNNVPRTGVAQFAFPKRRITMKVTAAEHQPWTYVDPITHDPFIEIDPSEHRHVQAELEKAPSSEASPK